MTDKKHDADDIAPVHHSYASACKLIDDASARSYPGLNAFSLGNVFAIDVFQGMSAGIGKVANPGGGWFSIFPAYDTKLRYGCDTETLDNADSCIVSHINSKMLETLDAGRAVAFTYCWTESRFEVMERRTDVVGIMQPDDVSAFMHKHGSGSKMMIAAIGQLGIDDYIVRDSANYGRRLPEDRQVTESWSVKNF